MWYVADDCGSDIILYSGIRRIIGVKHVDHWDFPTTVKLLLPLNLLNIGVKEQRKYVTMAQFSDFLFISVSFLFSYASFSTANLETQKEGAVIPGPL